VFSAPFAEFVQFQLLLFFLVRLFGLVRKIIDSFANLALKFGICFSFGGHNNKLKINLNIA